MKRIAIITFPGYTGSTIPLAKHFVKNGVGVDFYILTSKVINDFEAVSCKCEFNRFGINEIDSAEIGGLKAYMGDNQFSIYAISLPRPYKTIPIVKNIMNAFRKKILSKVIEHIKAQEYSFINLVGRFDSLVFLEFLNKIDNCVVSLHEVSEQKYFNDQIIPNKLISFLIKKDIPIIVYSTNSLKDIKVYDGLNQSNVSQINFGLFDSYRTITESDNLSLPDSYILYYGYILPYKGLSVLYQAINLLGDKLGNTKIVIAGAGTDDTLDKMKLDDRFLCINKYLSNNDIVTLNKHCQFVVCPYLRVSQSGIPQTSYVFNKPIVASDLSAFREMIIDGRNGLLFEPGNYEELARKIECLINDRALFERLTENVNCFTQNNLAYDWNNISRQYKKFVK